MRVGIPIDDLTAGNLLALGIMMAIFDRERTGVGRWVTTSLLEAQIFMLDFQASRWLIAKEVAPQAGNDHPTSMPTSAYRTKDGYINIAATGETMWRRVCEGIGRADLLEREDFKGEANRSKNRVALNAEINKATAARTTAEWIGILSAANVPCGPIYTIDKMFADPQVQHLGIAQPVEHPKLGPLELVGQGVNLSRAKGTPRTAAPDRGAHTRQVLQELGYDTAAIEDMEQRGIV
jgi:formyl-CoA transferase